MVSSDSSQHTVCIPECGCVYPTVSLSSLLSCIFSYIFSYVTRFIVILVVFVCSVIAAMVALPLLLAAFVVTRFLQFIYGCGYMYDKATELKVLIKLKLFLRTWLYLANLYLMCVVLVLYGVAHIPHLGLKDIHVLGYSIMHWINTYIIVFGICSLSYILTIISMRFLIFCIPLEYHTFKSGSLVVSDTVHEIIDCFILLLFAEHVIIMQAQFLKEYKLLGIYPIHTLFHVLVLLLVLHDLIGLSTHVLVWWLHKIVANPGSDQNSIRYIIITKYLSRKTLVYWANGLKPSIMFTRSALMLLTAWVSYFRNLLEKHEHDQETFRGAAAKKVSKVGTWTTLCLLFFSIFWLIKNCILLELENRIVYRKFGDKISQYGKHLYFLGVLGRRVDKSYDFLELRYDAKSTRQYPQTEGREDQEGSNNQKSGCVHAIKKAFSWEINKEHCKTDFTKGRGLSLLMLSIFPVFLIKEKARYQHQNDPEDNLGKQTTKSHDGKKLCLQRKKQAKEDLLKPTTMLYELQKKVQYFLAAKESLLQDKYTSHLLEHLTPKDTINDDGSIENSLKQLVDGAKDQNDNGAKDQNDDWNSFQDALNKPAGDKQPSTNYVKRLDTWLVEAHYNCVVLANKISSAKELVECLDTIMSWILIVLGFIVWLLLTGLTTTNGIILIGSPIVSFSFIFGNTANIFFQGIVFVYAVHPFDVGDLCLIENNMLEVIEIGVWKTTFSKVETREEVIFSNLDLMNKTVINHKTEFDWSDKVEIYVDFPESERINRLKENIEKELQDAKYESKPGGFVEVMTTPENRFKIVVTFQYNTELVQRESMNYFECFRKKRKLRSDSVQKLAAIVEEKKNTSEPKIQEPEIQTSP